MKSLRVLAFIIALLVPLFGTAAVVAQVPQFTSEAQAKQHCPSDIVVWVNLPSGIYHFRGQRYYANTKSGAFVCKKEADANGYRATKNGQ
jgi:hypothetical protein